MAPSSNSSNIENLRFESIRCGCGQIASIMVSRTQKNPRRLYCNYSVHGWLKWVLPNYVVENEVNYNPRFMQGARSEFTEVNYNPWLRRNVDGDVGAASHMIQRNDANTVLCSIWSWLGHIKILVAINLVLLAAYLFAQLINMLRS